MSESKQKKRKESSEDVSKNAVKSNTTIAALAMKGANPFQKIIVYCCYGVILLGIIALTVPPYQALKELLALAVTVIFLGIVAVVVLTRYKDLSRIPDVVSTSPTAIPPENLLLTISELKREHLRKLLIDNRNIAFEFLKSKNPEVSDNDVRANIFFPEYDSPTNLKQYKLKICPGLHLKMDYPPELNICFQPNQGATGNVFASGQARVAQRLTSGTGDWDDFYNITDDFVKTIHHDLKWIISMPLQVAGEKPMGVVNVDGLRYQFPNDVLYECMFKLTTNVMVMSNVLASR